MVGLIAQRIVREHHLVDERGVDGVFARRDGRVAEGVVDAEETQLHVAGTFTPS